MNYARLLWQLYRKKQTMKKSKEQVQTLQKNSSFEMIAQLSDITLSDQVKQAVTRQMKSVLEKNGLRDIAFTIRFVNQILPDSNTGKKALIIQGAWYYPANEVSG